MKSLAIFDLDGTLLNTIDDLGEATNFALAKCGFSTHPISSYPFFVGNGIAKLIERALPQEARDKGTIEKVKLHFLEYYNDNNTVYSKPYDGIPQLLNALSEQGIKLAVASNKYHEAVVKLINHYFTFINWVTIEGHKEGFPTKPDPSIVFDILSKSATQKDDVLYIGDSGVDMETARRAGVESIGVTWGFRPIEELQQFCANHIVNSTDEILKIATNL